MKHGMRERLIGAGVLIFLAIVFIPLFLGNKLDDLPLVQPEEIPPKPQSLDISVNPFTQPPSVYEIGDDYLDKEMQLEETMVANAQDEFDKNLPVQTNTLDKNQYYTDKAQKAKEKTKTEEKQKAIVEVQSNSNAKKEVEKGSGALAESDTLKTTKLNSTQSASNNSAKNQVKPSGQADSSTQLQKTGGGKMWAIQVASFSDSTKAREFLGKLEKMGFEGYWRKISKLAVVFVGPFTNSEKAQNNLKKLTAKLKGKYIVVKYINEYTAAKFGTLPPKNIRKSIK